MTEGITSVPCFGPNDFLIREHLGHPQNATISTYGEREFSRRVGCDLCRVVRTSDEKYTVVVICDLKRRMPKVLISKDIPPAIDLSLDQLEYDYKNTVEEQGIGLCIHANSICS